MHQTTGLARALIGWLFLNGRGVDVLGACSNSRGIARGPKDLVQVFHPTPSILHSKESKGELPQLCGCFLPILKPAARYFLGQREAVNKF